MIRILQSGWFAAIAGTLAFLGTTAVLITPAELINFISHEPAIPRSANGGIAWEFFNPEVDQLIAELKQQKESVATKEQQLNELATRLQAERAEIYQVTQSVHRLQQELDKIVVRARDEESANLKKLGKMYSTMSPEGAAAIIRQMDDDQAVKIMMFMKEGEAAPILEILARGGDLEAKRAVALTERLKRAVYRAQSP